MLTQILSPKKNNLDLVKFPDDFPPSFTFDIYKVAVIRKLNFAGGVVVSLPEIILRSHCEAGATGGSHICGPKLKLGIRKPSVTKCSSLIFLIVPSRVENSFLGFSGESLK